jgi:hypothetical protein
MLIQWHLYHATQNLCTYMNYANIRGAYIIILTEDSDKIVKIIGGYKKLYGFGKLLNNGE